MRGQNSSSRWSSVRACPRSGLQTEIREPRVVPFLHRSPLLRSASRRLRAKADIEVFEFLHLALVRTMPLIAAEFSRARLTRTQSFGRSILLSDHRKAHPPWLQC